MSETTTDYPGRVFGIIWKFVLEYEKSVAQYRNIKTGEEFPGYVHEQ